MNGVNHNGSAPTKPRLLVPDPAPRDVTAELLRLLGELLAAPPASPIHLDLAGNGVRVSLDVRTNDQPQGGQDDPRDLEPLQAALLRCLSASPVTAKTLARLAGYSMGSHVYAALRMLIARDLACRYSDGYCLPRGKEAGRVHD